MFFNKAFECTVRGLIIITGFNLKGRYFLLDEFKGAHKENEKHKQV